MCIDIVLIKSLFKRLVEKHIWCFTLGLCIFFFVCFRQNQVVLLETLEQEISKFKECNSIVDINALVSTSKFSLFLMTYRKKTSSDIRDKLLEGWEPAYFP